MGRSKTVRKAAALKSVVARIRQNTIRKESVMGRELNISRRSTSRLLSEDPRFRAYRQEYRMIPHPTVEAEGAKIQTPVQH